LLAQYLHHFSSFESYWNWRIIFKDFMFEIEI